MSQSETVTGVPADAMDAESAAPVDTTATTQQAEGGPRSGIDGGDEAVDGVPVAAVPTDGGPAAGATTAGVAVDDGPVDGVTAAGVAADEVAADGEIDLAALEQESEIAADYVEGLLDIADLDGDIDMDVEGDRAVVSVVGVTLDELVGAQGEVLEALQELTRLAVLRQTGERSRLMLDVGGYRKRRRAELGVVGAAAADEVRRTGEAKALTDMTPFERKIIHDAVAAAGLRSESEGEEPHRHVIVLPAAE